MLAIQEGSVRSADEKLAAVRVGPCISHGQDPRAIVLELQRFRIPFIPKLSARVNGFAASPIARGKIPTLNHEPWDDSVKMRAFVTGAGLSRCKHGEILYGSWHNRSVQTHDDSPRRIIVYAHVEVDQFCDWRPVWRWYHFLVRRGPVPFCFGMKEDDSSFV